MYGFLIICVKREKVVWKVVRDICGYGIEGCECLCCYFGFFFIENLMIVKIIFFIILWFVMNIDVCNDWFLEIGFFLWKEKCYVMYV